MTTHDTAAEPAPIRVTVDAELLFPMTDDLSNETVGAVVALIRDSIEVVALGGVRPNLLARVNRLVVTTASGL